MFNRKKPPAGPAGASAPRGRSVPEAAPAGRNPLARRFQDEAEPDTVDLAEPGRYHLPADDAAGEPDTRVTAAPGSPEPHAALLRLVTLDPSTGKFHVHPGNAERAVSLNGAAVESPTELRPGDRLEIGGAVFEFHS